MQEIGLSFMPQIELNTISKKDKAEVQASGKDI